MDKRQLIEAIQASNPHAQTRFLNQFSEQDLSEYLNRLQQAHQRSIRLKSWVKPVKRDYRMVS